jgi:hypothetical protein
MDEVKIVRLTTGEELLCKMDPAMTLGEGKSILINTPVLILPTADGKLTFMPYMPYADIKDLIVKERSVMFIVDPTEELAAQYKNMIGDVVIPPKPKILV